MKTKNYLIQISVILLLMAGAFSGYALGKSTPKIGNDSSYENYLPSLVELDIPSQTINGITADLESYYADGLRLVFAVRITGEADSFAPDNVTIKDNSNQLINGGYGFQADADDLSLYLIDFYLDTPIADEKLEGVLEINMYTMKDSETTNYDASKFAFEVNVPLKPMQKFAPNQTVSVNNVEMLLSEVLISPAFTKIYVCYNKPSNADWMIGSSEIIVDSQTATLNAYSLLFDSGYGDMGKGIEPNWFPPIEEGRCVKLGYPIGSENPKSIELNILNLQQSMPEVIPENELEIAYEKLLAQGIDMKWNIIDHGAFPVYNKLPDGMTKLEAYQTFIEALGYVYKGAWGFTINP